MKIILVILIVFFSGCSNNHKLNITSIQTINYNEINLIEDDFDKVLNEINKLEFKEGSIENIVNSTLKIVSNDKIYNFKMFNNIIYYEEDNKIYISEETYNLNIILNAIKTKYTDFSFFKITYDKCNITDNNMIIKIDNTSNCLILNTSKILYNFRINSIMSINNEIIETGLIYQKDEIKSTNTLIKLDVLGTYKNKISFDTEYDYTISMFPIYDSENNLQLNISSIQKK